MGKTSKDYIQHKLMESSLIGICAKRTSEEMFKFLHRGFCSSSKLGILILCAKPVPFVVLLVTGTIRKGKSLVLGCFVIIIFLILWLYMK